MSDTQTLELYNNPGLIQSRVISDMEARVLGGNTIVDGNSVPAHLIESFSVETAGVVGGLMNELDALYAKRAQSPSHLYKHMSSFDYVGLFATPSSLRMELVLRKDLIIQEAVTVNSTYNQITIPKDSVFVIDQYAFTLYYPITIRVNKITNTITVAYDIDEVNPLHTLSQNTLEHRTITLNGLDLLTLNIPVYQFARTVSTHDVSEGASFVEAFTYTSQFYAIRVFANTGTDEAWEEIEHTLSDEVYDPDQATAIVTVDPELKTLKVSIPQIYLTNSMIGSRIKIEILTTEGALDADTTSVRPENLSATFPLTGDAEADKYTQFLQKPEVISLRPISTRILGGSDGIDFETLRQRVIHNTLHGQTLLGPLDIEHYFADKGFISKIYEDSITDRIYKLFKELRDIYNVIVPAGNVPCKFTASTLQATATINDNSDTSYTVLPTTLYEYDPTTGICTPLTDAEVATLTSMSRDEKVAAYNGKIYTRHPYHLRIETADRYPLAYAYDLTDPKINVIEFLKENVSISTQLSVYAAQIVHAQPGDGGFVVELEVTKSEDIRGLDNSNFKVVVTAKNVSGATVFQEATFVEAASDTVDLYRATFTTDYDISEEHMIEILSLQNSAGTTGHFIPLDGTLGAVFFIDGNLIPPGTNTTTDVGLEVADSFPGFVPVTEQALETVLGVRIGELFTKLDVMYSSQQYETYEETEYATYKSRVYERDNDGNIVYTIGGGGETIMNIVHEVGDIIYNRQDIFLGTDTIENYYGSIILTPGNLPIELDVFTMSGAGVAAVNAAFLEMGIHDTKPYYYSGQYYAYWHAGGGYWAISDVLGDADVDALYSNAAADATLPTTGWATQIGTAPTPTIVASTTSEVSALTALRYENTLQPLDIPVVLHATGDPVLDAQQNPIVSTDREVIYMIDLLQVSSKLELSQQPEHVVYFETLAQQLRTYFDAVADAVPQLREEMHLFFQPLRTMGIADFKVGNGISQQFNLELSIALKLYVYNHVISDTGQLAAIRKSIVSIIDQHVAAGSISTTVIAEEIRDTMPTMVKYVDVLGINGQNNLQTLISTTTDVVPSLGQDLVVEDDGTIGVRRSLDLTFIDVDIAE